MPKARISLILGLALLVGQAHAGVIRYYATSAEYFKAKPKGSGFGFLDFDGKGSYVTFDVDLPTSGEHTFTVSYVAPTKRPLDFIVDGATMLEFGMPKRASWQDWGTESKSVSLSQGPHRVQLKAVNSWGPNIEWIEVNSPDPPSVGVTIALRKNENLQRNDFVFSPSGVYKLGVLSTGNLVLQDQASHTIWSAGSTGSEKCWMQDDGNLVCRDANQQVKFASQTPSPGAHLEVSDAGSAAIVNSEAVVWIVNKETPSSGGDVTADHHNIFNREVPEQIVLEPASYIQRGHFRASPNGKFKVGLTQDRGELQVQDTAGNTIWSASWTEDWPQGKQGYRAYMQNDGNLIVRDSNLRAVWNTKTSGNPGARFILDDGGQAAIKFGEVRLWLDGIPRGVYTKPPAANDIPKNNVRGAFYYPWYPETWKVNGATALFEPELGYYSSADPTVIENHVDQLEYAYVDLSIASWWGQDTNLDKARLELLMDETMAMNSNMKWSVYHEDERWLDQSVAEIKEDLNYLKKWFAWHPAWAHRDQKPVIFVYNEGGSCEVADRWSAASNGEWYVVLKVFKGYAECVNQPDSWHQYGPAVAVNDVAPFTYSISPGFWKADLPQPHLARVGQNQFCQNAKAMVESNADWQLITTFNEAGEGTMIEASPHWRSNSKYGYYLDCLHRYH